MANRDLVSAAPIPRRRLWLGLTLAPLAFTLEFAVGYVLVARSCEGDNGMHATGLAGIRWVDLGMAVVMVIVAVVGLMIALGSLREAQRKPAPNDLRTEQAAGAHFPAARGTAPWWDRELFMARAGVIGSSLFVGGTVLFVLAPLLLNICSQAH